MPPALPESVLTRLSQFVAGEMALEFPEARWRDLERGILAASRKAGARDVESYVEWLLSAPLNRTQIESLAGELTVGETYFFRDRRIFDLLGESILPELIPGRQSGDRRLRIWSAGCCTGEEPYSIAILLDRILPLASQWQITILATDINPRYLKKASEGIYTEWSFRNPPSWLKQDYFTPAPGKRYQIIQRIRDRVTFEYLNLADDSYPSLLGHTNAMDLIFCRNVLMYFSPERARHVAGKMQRCLVDKGWFIVSPTEVSSEIFPQFTPVYFDGAILYRKGQAPALPAPAWSMPMDSFPALPPAEEPRALFEAGEFAEAKERIETAAGQAEPDVDQMTLLAKICANMGELSNALAWTEKALAADKLRPGIHYLRATILQEQGAMEEAAAALRRAIYLEPGFVLAYFALGNLALGRHRREEAERHFAHALDALAGYQADDVLPESDGLAAGRLRQIIESTLSMENAA
ncbi:MAG TPA: CheR family methyltransferase [Chthoniobacteraceae bacterium]|jgi:chemotaxis protein methyltransferase CheR|nr:CheR family methyltransferase [Chthoniobacteraceae bacterium]